MGPTTKIFVRSSGREVKFEKVDYNVFYVITQTIFDEPKNYCLTGPFRFDDPRFIVEVK